MTERKVLNKYFPPDYDPSKIPRLRRGSRSKQFNIRTMAPFNMRCTTCNGYIYKAKKFNSRMETAENVDYLGLRHYRFYIRCPLCCAEIIWRNGDYLIESGAKRNFEALKTAEELEAKRQAEEEEEIANNPMKLLEKRTDQSKQEMEMVEVIEDLKQLNQRQAGMEADHVLLRKMWHEEEDLKNAEIEADETLLKQLLTSMSEKIIHLPSESKPNGSSSNFEEKSDIGKSILITKTGTSNNSAKSYLKRQLQGVINISKPVANKLPNTNTNSSLSSSLTVNHTNNSLHSTEPSSKMPKFNDVVTIVDSQSKLNVLPGMIYSDHSDSDS